MATKPTDSLHDWTDGAASKVTEPSLGKKDLGFIEEEPAFQHVNWLFYLSLAWNQYFETVTDELLAVQSSEFDRIVGSGADATDADLATAIANASAGDSILVTENETLDTTIALSKNNIYVKFKPGITFSENTAGTALDITGNRCRVEGGRWSGFTTAIDVDAGADYCMLRDNWFTGNTTEVSMNSTTSDEQGSIYE